MLLSDVVLKVLRVCYPLVIPTKMIGKGLCSTCHTPHRPVGCYHSNRIVWRKKYVKIVLIRLTKT